MRFSSSLIAFVYLGFAAAAAIPVAPAVAAVNAQPVSTYVSPLRTQTPANELHVRMLPNLGNPTVPPPKPTVPAAAPPVKVPRGDSEVLGNVPGVAGKAGKKGAIGMACREGAHNCPGVDILRSRSCRPAT